MRTLLPRLAAIAFAFCLALLPVLPGGAQSGGAQTLSVPVRANDSARAAFREAFVALHAFDGLQLRSAFADKADHFVQGAFTGRYRGVPVTGILVAGRSGVALAAFDIPARAGQTVPALLAQIASSMPSGRGAAGAPLHTVSFGTGTIGLPASWQVTNSYQGCVEAASTSDHGYLAFGCPQAGFAPPVLPGADSRAVLVLPYADPAAMFRAFAQYPLPVGLGVQSVRVAEAQPVPPPAAGARSSYVLFDYRTGGKAYRGLALVTVAPIDRGSYMFYKSMFMLPQPSFPRLAPTLWKSWQSWGVSSGVLTGRLTAAAQSMRETGDIITGAYWDRQHANAQTSLGFSQYIRETAQLEDVSTGRRYNGSYFDASTIVQNNPVKYRIVPIGELQP